MCRIVPQSTLQEQCRPLSGGMAGPGGVSGGFCHWVPLCAFATQRLPERWNDVSGGWTRTGPPFWEPRLASKLLSRASSKKGLHLRPYLLVSRVQCACAVLGDTSEQLAKHRGAASRLWRVSLQAKACAASRSRSGGRGRACASSTLRTAASARARLCCSLARLNALRPRRSRKPETTAQVLGAPRRAEERITTRREHADTLWRIAHPLAAAGIKRRR